MQKTFFINLVKQRRLSVPGGHCIEELLTLFFRAGVAHLDDNQGVLAFWASGEYDIRVQLTWCALHAVAEVFDEGRRRRGRESTIP